MKKERKKEKKKDNLGATDSECICVVQLSTHFFSLSMCAPLDSRQPRHTPLYDCTPSSKQQEQKTNKPRACNHTRQPQRRDRSSAHPSNPRLTYITPSFGGWCTMQKQNKQKQSITKKNLNGTHGPMRQTNLFLSSLLSFFFSIFSPSAQPFYFLLFPHSFLRVLLLDDSHVCETSRQRGKGGMPPGMLSFLPRPLLSLPSTPPLLRQCLLSISRFLLASIVSSALSILSPPRTKGMHALSLPCGLFLCPPLSLFSFSPYCPGFAVITTNPLVFFPVHAFGQ